MRNIAIHQAHYILAVDKLLAFWVNPSILDSIIITFSQDKLPGPRKYALGLHRQKGGAGDIL